jgi:hypothetical protein
MEDAVMADTIKVKNPIEEREKGNPERDRSPELGDEAKAGEVTSANEELQRAHGDDPAPESNQTRLDDISGPEHSVDEHAPTGAESAEDKAIDVINSGILRI